MKKFLKNLGVFCVVCVLATTSVSAASDMSGYEYEELGTRFYYEECGRELVINRRTDPKITTVECSRTKTWEGSIAIEAGYEAQLGAVTASASVNAEVGYGESDTVTYSCECVTPPGSMWYSIYGSEWSETYGHLRRWFRGKVKSMTTVDMEWTYAPYYDDEYVGKVAIQG